MKIQIKLAAAVLLASFCASAQNNISGVFGLPVTSNPTGIACVATSPLLSYQSNIYSCQSSAYALYAGGGGGGAPTGPAGGDLSGNYPDPTVVSINGKAVTLSGNLTTTGAFNPTFAIPSSSAWTFPPGPSTLMSTATVLASGQVPVFTGDVTASGLALTVGSIGGKTVTLGGNLAITGAFNPTFAIPSSSAWTFPAGPSTLMSTATVLASGQMPTFTGDVSNSGLAMTVGAIGGKTVTLSGNFTTTGAFNPTFAIPSSSAWTFPPGPSTLMSTATVLGSAQMPTFTGDVSNSGLAMTVASIGGKTVSLAGNLTTSGAFNTTVTTTATTAVTLPPAGTLTSTVAVINTTGLTNNVGSTLLYAVPAGGAGMYAVTCYAVVTTAAGVSSTLPACDVQWTDADTSVQIALSAFSGTSAGNTAGTNTLGAGGNLRVLNAAASTNINYSTAGYASSAANAMTYALHIRLVYLGS